MYRLEILNSIRLFILLALTSFASTSYAAKDPFLGVRVGMPLDKAISMARLRGFQDQLYLNTFLVLNGPTGERIALFVDDRTQLADPSSYSRIKVALLDGSRGSVAMATEGDFNDYVSWFGPVIFSSEGRMLFQQNASSNDAISYRDAMANINNTLPNSRLTSRVCEQALISYKKFFKGIQTNQYSSKMNTPEQHIKSIDDYYKPGTFQSFQQCGKMTLIENGGSFVMGDASQFDYVLKMEFKPKEPMQAKAVSNSDVVNYTGILGIVLPVSASEAKGIVEGNGFGGERRSGQASTQYVSKGNGLTKSVRFRKEGSSENFTTMHYQEIKDGYSETKDWKSFFGADKVSSFSRSFCGGDILELDSVLSSGCTVSKGPNSIKIEVQGERVGSGVKVEGSSCRQTAKLHAGKGQQEYLQISLICI